MVKFGALKEGVFFELDKKICVKLEGTKAYTVGSNQTETLEANPYVVTLSDYDLKKKLRRNMAYVKIWKETVVEHANRIKLSGEKC